MITIVQKGHPKDTKNKRILRIKEALAFPMGTKEKPTSIIIDSVNGKDVFFTKPGKEYFREKKQNPNDMSPNVGNAFEKYSFSDIWKDMLKLSSIISKDSFKKLNALIYRLAYMLDFEILDEEKVRFRPNKEVIDEIEEIQNEINRCGYRYNILELFHFLDILGWNEDVKYQAEYDFINAKKGRINMILSMVSIPLIFKKFIDEIIESKDTLQNIDYSLLIDTAQTFARTRGVQPISNTNLIQFLYPYLQQSK